MKKTSDGMRQLLPMFLLCLIGACATPPRETGTTYDSAKKEMSIAARARQSSAQAEDVSKALLPPLTVEMRKVVARPTEPLFILAVKTPPAARVFLAFVPGTPYGMVVHPGARDQTSVTLRVVP